MLKITLALAIQMQTQAPFQINKQINNTHYRDKENYLIILRN